MSATGGKAAATIPDSDTPITAEERALLCNYRELARRDRTFLFMILQAMARGRHTGKTDRYSLKKILAISDMPRSRKAAA